MRHNSETIIRHHRGKREKIPYKTRHNNKKNKGGQKNKGRGGKQNKTNTTPPKNNHHVCRARNLNQKNKQPIFGEFLVQSAATRNLNQDTIINLKWESERNLSNRGKGIRILANPQGAGEHPTSIHRSWFRFVWCSSLTGSTPCRHDKGPSSEQPAEM
ncbi:unnamed protein product [Ectocarpus sp. 8 AP-2014]